MPIQLKRQFYFLLCRFYTKNLQNLLQIVTNFSYLNQCHVTEQICLVLCCSVTHDALMLLADGLLMHRGPIITHCSPRHPANPSWVAVGLCDSDVVRNAH